MDSFTDIVKDILPFIGTALGGPLGGAAAAFVGSKLGIPDATIATVTSALQGMTPEKLAALKTADNEFQLQMAQAGFDSTYKIAQLNIQAQADVNKTMQVETTSEHWASWMWRPFIGFTFGFYINSLWVLPLFHITPIPLNSDIVLAIGGILGVASWFRGKAQADTNNTAITQG